MSRSNAQAPHRATTTDPSCRTPRTGGCGDKGSASPTIDGIVTDYIDRFRKRGQQEQRYFSVLRTDEQAVEAAALASLPSGKRHPHQYRIPRSALAESRDKPPANLPALRAAGSFDELLDLVQQIIGPIRGIGELAVYDTALRIGARFGLEAERVYLHAGTRLGARALGFGTTRESIALGDLPRPIQRLNARGGQDLLCIYKSELGVAARDDARLRPRD